MLAKKPPNPNVHIFTINNKNGTITKPIQKLQLKDSQSVFKKQAPQLNFPFNSPILKSFSGSPSLNT